MGIINNTKKILLRDKKISQDKSLRIFKHKRQSFHEMQYVSPPQYSGDRPLKVRKNPLKYSSYRGVIRTTKHQQLKSRSAPRFPYESILERDFFICLDHDLYCTEMIAQPYITLDIQEVKYSVDCWSAFYTGRDWKIYLFEIKPKKIKEKLDQNDENWKRKIIHLKNYCRGKNEEYEEQKRNIEWKFKIITDEHIYTTRFSNIGLFRSTVLIPPNNTHIQTIRNVLLKLYQKKTEYTLSELKVNIHNMLKHEKKLLLNGLIEKILNYFLYYQQLWFDWEKQFSAMNTLISANFDYTCLATPFYNIEPSKQQKIPFTTEKVHAEYDIGLLNEQLIQEAKRRLRIIQPLVEKKKNKTLSRNDVKKRSDETNASPRSIYYWLHSYMKSSGDWKSLIKKNHRKGNRSSRWPYEVEEIIQEEIMNRTPMMDDLTCWRNIERKCNESGFIPPSYRTILRRIKQIPARERVGKQGGYIRDEIMFVTRFNS